MLDLVQLFRLICGLKRRHRWNIMKLSMIMMASHIHLSYHIRFHYSPARKKPKLAWILLNSKQTINKTITSVKAEQVSWIFKLSMPEVTKLNKVKWTHKVTELTTQPKKWPSLWLRLSNSNYIMPEQTE